LPIPISGQYNYSVEDVKKALQSSPSIEQSNAQDSSNHMSQEEVNDRLTKEIENSEASKAIKEKNSLRTPSDFIRHRQLARDQNEIEKSVSREPPAKVINNYYVNGKRVKVPRSARRANRSNSVSGYKVRSIAPIHPSSAKSNWTIPSQRAHATPQIVRNPVTIQKTPSFNQPQKVIPKKRSLHEQTFNRVWYGNENGSQDECLQKALYGENGSLKASLEMVLYGKTSEQQQLPKSKPIKYWDF
jgi:hypothetical protein